MGWAAKRARAVLGAMDGAFAGDGIVVAVAALDREGPVIVTTEGLPPDARFEIGSVTKTMTATLLAVLALGGALTLDDPAGRWLDAGQNADITLGQLATHTSGLPREAPNHTADGPNPYRAFTAERAEEGLRAVARKPGGGRAYSSFGYQLLGLVLERAAGRPYQDLLADLLLGPLGMTCSGVGAAGGGTRLTGHAGGRPADHWDRALPGAGGVEASVGDLAIYLAAGLAPPPGRLGDAIAMCLRPRVPIDAELAGGLGWMIGRGQGDRGRARTGVGDARRADRAGAARRPLRRCPRQPAAGRPGGDEHGAARRSVGQRDALGWRAGPRVGGLLPHRARRRRRAGQSRRRPAPGVGAADIQRGGADRDAAAAQPGRVRSVVTALTPAAPTSRPPEPRGPRRSPAAPVRSTPRSPGRGGTIPARHPRPAPTEATAAAPGSQTGCRSATGNAGGPTARRNARTSVT